MTRPFRGPASSTANDFPKHKCPGKLARAFIFHLPSKEALPLKLSKPAKTNQSFSEGVNYQSRIRIPHILSILPARQLLDQLLDKMPDILSDKWQLLFMSEKSAMVRLPPRL